MPCAASRPRRPDDRLFDRAVLARGLLQGSGLLVLLCAVYAWSRHETLSDEIARAMSFTVLVLSNIGLIYVNRSWDASLWQARRRANRYFNWMALLAAGLLAIVLATPEIARLFSFALPPVGMLSVAIGSALLGTLWFDAVTSQMRRRAADPPAVHRRKR
ncbi:cation transporting ATPase C-terminal domain-containing protein [Massilia sp. WF1]|uniref:cation transporting ATPase C-terminal domain-containing protein n=1 Tax=Massilia sp. WF1 TaxID=1406431 RepID=UPI001E633C49|nr:cation-translocating P-type ATPase C-terminal domain-containing protein [Massilia sp. WF1]